jgi:hypothetical protein
MNAKSLSLLGLLGLLAVGCVHNVTGDSRYPTDFRTGQVYRTQCPLVATGLWSPYAIYDPAVYPELKGVGIQPGTGILVEKIVVENRWLEGRFIWVNSRFVDGPLSGKRVSIPNISNQTNSLRIDPKYLKLSE